PSSCQGCVTTRPLTLNFSSILVRAPSAPLRSAYGPARTFHSVSPPLPLRSTKLATPPARRRSRSLFASASALNAPTCTAQPPARLLATALGGASAVGCVLDSTTLLGTLGSICLIFRRALSAAA